MINCGAKVINKTDYRQSAPSLSKYIDKPRRITSHHYNNQMKKKLYRMTLKVLISLDNLIPFNEKSLKPKLFIRYPKSQLKIPVPGLRLTQAELSNTQKDFCMRGFF